MKNQLSYKGQVSRSIIAILCFFITAVCLSIVGCVYDDDNNESDDTIWYYNQVGLCSDGSYDVEQAQYLTNTMYKMLGMLNEYISRFSYVTGEPYPDLVERGLPATELADYFEELILQFRDETQLSFEYTRETIDQRSVNFYSTDFSEIINSFYIKPYGFSATLDRNVFCDASEEDMLSYIESVYMRYGSEDKKNYIDMANAPDKMITIGLVLQELGCDNVSVYRKTEGTPTEYLVIFEPNELVANRLDIQRVLPVEELITGKTILIWQMLLIK